MLEYMRYMHVNTSRRGIDQNCKRIAVITQNTLLRDGFEMLHLCPE